MRKLTERQQRVLDFLVSYISESGYPPTRAEIANELGFRSANAAEEHLKALAKKGAIEMIPGASRGIRISTLANDVATPATNDSSKLPIIGRVAAGSPILATEHVEEMVELDPRLFRPHADYLLRVKGESMINVGILDGDLLAVHKTEHARHGDIVVARIDDEVTVKRLHHTNKSSKILLIAENDNYDPIEVDMSCADFTIEGLSVGVIRQSF